ncbi:unnamed protein product [Orchesella dallaii]|uniref:Uncharacterized protein n=1 Tax=Orchesella dallaii TaxID=48710 RepID=A0ABP1QQX5_9HEXA
MRCGRSTWRRKYIKAKQAKLAKLRENLGTREFLLRMSSSFRFLSETDEYCALLQIQLANHYTKRTEYTQLLIDLCSRQLLRPGSDVRLRLSIENAYSALKTRAEIICKKVGKGLSLEKVKLKKLESTLTRQFDPRKGRAKEDPVGFETEVEQAIVKAKEIKSKMESLRAEWNGVKDELNSAIDRGIDQINLLLQDIIWQELGPIEE